MFKVPRLNKCSARSTLFILNFMFLISASAEIISRNVNISTGKEFLANDKCIGSVKITISAGEKISGSGYFESPEIEISTKEFCFTGTIKCDGTCVITTEVPFDHTMFKRQGKGQFIFKVEAPKIAAEPSKNVEKPVQETAGSQAIVNNDTHASLSNLEQAVRYRDGIGVSQDMKKAIDYLTLASEEGSDFALTQLGIYYYEGISVTKDFAKAVALFNRGAEKGNAHAAFYLGLCYYYGNGVKKDDKTAFNFFLKSAHKDHIDGTLMAAQYYLYGLGVQKSTVSARRLVENLSFKDMTSEQIDLRFKIIRECLKS